MRDEAQALYNIIIAALGEVLPPGWVKAQVEAQMVNGRLKVSAAVTEKSAGGAMRPQAMPANSALLEFMQLRELMATHPQDHWENATLTIFPDGAFDCAFGYLTTAQIA